MPIKTTIEAMREATIQLLQESRDYYLIGEGVPDPKGAFGTTTGLKEMFPDRVWDMPVSENGMTGVGIGSSLLGMRPIMVHMRADFLLYAADQIINNAAKWFNMFGGQRSVPMVIRAVIGRGWGQGIQHSQHLEHLFAEIPGLHVVCPSNAYDAKGMLIWAARNPNPVLFLDHRWIHSLKCEVPDEMYEIYPSPNIVHVPKTGFPDATIKTYGYLVHEALEAAKHRPLAVWDTRGPLGANWTEKSCCPPSPYLSKGFYPTAQDLGALPSDKPHDVPNEDFVGPF